VPPVEWDETHGLMAIPARGPGTLRIRRR